YEKLATYSEPIERLLAAAPRHQIQIHISEEFFADTRAAYLKTLEFLGLDDDGRTDFRVYNAAFTMRYRTALAWVHRTARRGSTPYRAAKGLANAVGLRPASWFVAFNRRARRNRDRLPSVDPAFEQVLRRRFEPEIDRLEKLL